MIDGNTALKQKGRAGKSPRLEVEAGTTVRLYPGSQKIALRALSEWTPLSSLSAFALVWSEGTLSFSLLLRTGAQYLSRDTLEKRETEHMQRVQASLKQHLKRSGIEAHWGIVEIQTRS